MEVKKIYSNGRFITTVYVNSYDNSIIAVDIDKKRVEITQLTKEELDGVYRVADIGAVNIKLEGEPNKK